MIAAEIVNSRISTALEVLLLVGLVKVTIGLACVPPTAAAEKVLPVPLADTEIAVIVAFTALVDGLQVNVRVSRVWGVPPREAVRVPAEMLTLPEAANAGVTPTAAKTGTLHAALFTTTRRGMPLAATLSSVCSTLIHPPWVTADGHHRTLSDLTFGQDQTVVEDAAESELRSAVTARRGS
ncbi:hypothetical protein [Tessaracoccus sp. Y1736]